MTTPTVKQSLSSAKRIVVKVGSSLLVDPHKGTVSDKLLHHNNLVLM